jgi:hypothetical protein
MIQRFVLHLKKWFALRRFPHGIPKSSFIFFDYQAPFSGLHNRVFFSETAQGHQLTVAITEDFNNRCRIEMNLTLGQTRALFACLKGRLKSFKLNKWTVRLWHDPLSLRLFAFEAETKWSCNISLNDARCFSELLFLRDQFIEVIKSIQHQSHYTDDSTPTTTS